MAFPSGSPTDGRLPLSKPSRSPKTTLFERSAGASGLLQLHHYIIFYLYHPFDSPYVDSSILIRTVYFDSHPLPSSAPSPRAIQLPTGHPPSRLAPTLSPSSLRHISLLSPSQPTPHSHAGRTHALLTLRPKSGPGPSALTTHAVG